MNPQYFLRSNILKNISSKISIVATKKTCPPWIKNPCPPCAPWIHNISCEATSHKRFPPKISSRRLPKISVSSVCSVDYSECPPCAPWINPDDPMIDFCDNIKNAPKYITRTHHHYSQIIIL